MGYLITQIIICLLIAVMIGFVIGWLLRGLGLEVDDEDMPKYKNQGAVDTSFLDEDVDLEPVTIAPSISHKIEKIDGLEKGMVKVLHKNGIKTTKDLIEKCSSKHGLQRIISSTEALESTVKQWVSLADIMRIPDINGRLAKLIEACGIKSTEALAEVDPQLLVNEMQSVNQRELLFPESIPLPDFKQMVHFIREAKTL
ncbi:MAG: DUF4332 domain-containing protein [Methylococcaceae bacterium]